MRTWDPYISCIFVKLMINRGCLDINKVKRVQGLLYIVVHRMPINREEPFTLGAVDFKGVYVLLVFLKGKRESYFESGHFESGCAKNKDQRKRKKNFFYKYES